ncbi:Aste57867_15670 [Aphanomyces stellatus]|uniref:Vacuolar protein 8 n=1 Tax=Aphanomyces stellatus TaxID=120398 RepID=A0A485L6M0_9STRA|nr:hypothetical protein As57867_015614 [Aphanomyces stellatus]VFT92464.1 Aste57867_15670 [Aphanomyces stellatus]
MGQITSAPCGSSLGPSTACSAASWEEVDVDDLQTQPIDIRHFLRRAEDEAQCWKARQLAQVQPIRLVTPADRFANRALKCSKQDVGRADYMPPTLLSPDEAVAALPLLMDDRWVYPLVGMLTSKDNKVAEMAMAALARVLDSEARQAMVVEAHGIEKLVHALAYAHLQRVALDALTALCNGNREISLDVAKRGTVDTIFDVCKLKLSNADDRKCSALQTLQMLVKHAEVKAMVATPARVTLLVDFLSHAHAPLAFYALSCLSELFHCASARKAAIAVHIIPTLLHYLQATATCNKTILLQAVYALSILGTHESDAFPLDDSVDAISHVMEVLRGALKRSRLASLVCMLVTGLSWQRPACHRFQVALREKTSPNLFAILASLLIGGSHDVLCAASIAVAALTHACLDNVHAFAKLDVHTILAKLLPHKDDRVSTCAAMGLSHFLTAYSLTSTKHTIAREPWQRDVAQAILDCSSPDGSSLDILYAIVVHGRVLDGANEWPPLVATLRPSAYEIQTALRLFVFCGEKHRWTNDAAITRLLGFLDVAATDQLLDLLLFFQTCTDPLGGDIEPKAFCDLLLAHGGLSQLMALLDDARASPPHACAVLATTIHLSHVYFSQPMPQPPAVVAELQRHVVDLVAHTDALDVLRVAVKLLDVTTDAKYCLSRVTLDTLLAGDLHCLANLLFAHCPKVQHGIALVLSRLVRHSRAGADAPWTPLPGALHQLTALLAVPDVAYAASHAWGSLLDDDNLALCEVFSTHVDGVPALLDLLETQRRPKHLTDTGRTLYRAAKHPAIQAQLLGRGLLLLEAAAVHVVDSLAHYAMLTLGQVGKNESLRHAAFSPSLVRQLLAFLASTPDDETVFPEPRRVCNVMDALCLVGEVCTDAASQQIALHAGLVDQVVGFVLAAPGQMDDVKLCALSALATLCTADATTREHILSDAVVDAVLRYLDADRESATEELVLLCLNILFQLLKAPATQALLAKSPRLGNILRTLRFDTSEKIRSLACQVIAVVACRCDSVKGDLCRMDVNNILFNLVVIESRDRPQHLQATSRVQRHALHALSVLCEGASPAAKTNKHEIFDLPDAVSTLLGMLRPPACVDAVESTALLAAILANATYHSPRNQRLVLQRHGGEAKLVALLEVYVGKMWHTSAFVEMLAIESMRALANLAMHPENRRDMGSDELLAALFHALQSDVAELHRFAALTMAQLCTGNDQHKVAMGAHGGLLPALAERLSSKHPHVLENVCFAITKLGTHGGNKIVFGANLVFERLLPLVLHTEIAIQKMAMTAIVVLIDGNDRNKASVVECNAIPILCGLCNASGVHTRLLEGALHTLAEIVPNHIVDVSKSINPAMLIHMLGSVNAKLQKAALQLLAHLTKESLNKVRYGDPSCVAAVVACLDPSSEEGRREDECAIDSDDDGVMQSLVDSEADLVIVELAATALANLSFEPRNTPTIVETDATLHVVSRLGELMESALQVAHADQRSQSPTKAKRKGGLSPLKLLPPPTNQEPTTMDARVVRPLLPSRPMQCQHILEQCSLVVNNCAHEILATRLVTESLVVVVCRMITHSSDLVKKCACFILTSWCAKQPPHQAWVMAQPHVLSTLIGMLNSSSPGILEAALWILTKLSTFGDTYVKMAANDIVRILESIVFRFHTTLGSGILDRAIRLLGNLGLHDTVRRTIRGEALVAGPLTSILDHQKQPLDDATTLSHVKNTTRLVGILLTDDALKLFFPKKALGVLQTIYVAPAAPVKVQRNIVVVFWLLSVVEEHRPLLARADDHDVVARLLAALARDEHDLAIRAHILSMLALWSGHEAICHTLFARGIVSSVLKYLVVADLDCARFAAVVVHHLSTLKDQVRTQLAAEGTTEIVLSLLRQCVDTPAPFDAFAYHLAGILANLTTHDDVKSVVVHAHGVATVLNFMRWKLDERVHDEAGRRGGDVLDLCAKIVANLSFDDASQVELVSLGCIELVLQVLGRAYASLAGVENYVLCLGNLSTVADAAIPRLERASAIPILLALLETHVATSPWISKCVIWAVSNMAMGSLTSKHQIHAFPHGLNLVLSLLAVPATQTKQTDTIVECALSCLSSIVQEEEIAHALGTCAALGHVLRFLEPDVRQSLQRKAVKIVGALASFGHAVYIDDLSRTHTNLLSIATDGTLKSIAPHAIHALRRISHLRNESPHVLCTNVAGIDALLQLITSDAASTVVDALHLIHHIATVTAPILSNAEYFASKRTCTQASELLSATSSEVEDGVVRLVAYLLAQSRFDHPGDTVENWPLVLSRLCRWWERQPDLAAHALCSSLLAGLDQMLACSTFVHTLHDAILTPKSLQCLSDLLPRLVDDAGDPSDDALACARAIVHLAASSPYYKTVLRDVGFPAQLLALLLVTPDEDTVLLLVVLGGIDLFNRMPGGVDQVFAVERGAARLLHLIFDGVADVATLSLTIVHVLVHVAPAVFRTTDGVASLAAKLQAETTAESRVRLLDCLVALWDDTPTTCRAVHESRVVPSVLATMLPRHSTESLRLLHALSTSIYFHLSLFHDAMTFLDLLRARTSASADDTTLVLSIVCNMCGCGGSPDHNDLCDQAILPSFIRDWADLNLIGTLLPLSQWMDAPVQAQKRRADLVSPRWATHVELVLRLLGKLMREPHHRLVFRDGVDLPDLLALLRVPISTMGGILEGVATVLAHISLEKDIQIMVVVEDGVTFLAKVLMAPETTLAVAYLLVQTVRNLSHDVEVQAILAAQHTFPYFIQLVASLAATSSSLAILAVEILHDISTTPQWVDVLIDHQCHQASVALLLRPSPVVDTSLSSSVDIDSLSITTLSNLCRTTTPAALATLHASSTVLQLTHLALPLFSSSSERHMRQLSLVLAGAAHCSQHSDAIRDQLASHERFFHALIAWFIAADAFDFADDAAAVTLLASQCSAPVGRQLVTRHHSAPSFLGRVAAVCMGKHAPHACHEDCLALLAHCLGPDVDVVDQRAWDYGFVAAFIACDPLHAALAAPTSTSALVVLHMCLRYTDFARAATPPYAIPLPVVLAAVAAVATHTALALAILHYMASSDATRRLIVDTAALDAFLVVAAPLLAQGDVQALARKLLDAATDDHVARDTAIVPLLVAAYLPKDLLHVSVLSFLGHLALLSPAWCTLVLTAVRAAASARTLLAKNVESIHARTCSRASVNAAAVVSPPDMLRVYLFAITMDEGTSSSPPLWRDVSTAICFVQDILSWHDRQLTNDDPAFRRRFGQIYPVLLYCTSRLLHPTADHGGNASIVSDADVPWQGDILRGVLHILTRATDTAIQVSSLNTLLAINKLWRADAKLLQLLECSSDSKAAIERIVGLLTTSKTAALEMLTLLVTAGGDVVDTLKALGVKAQLECLEINSPHEKAMTTAILNLLGYSIDLSEAFVLDLAAFCDETTDGAARAARLAKMQATLDMDVVTDDAILERVIPTLVAAAARGPTFRNECIQCLAKVAGFSAFAACDSAPPTLLRLYVDEFNTLTGANQDVVMDMLLSLHARGVTANGFGFWSWRDAFPTLCALATSLVGCNMAATGRILTFLYRVATSSPADATASFLVEIVVPDANCLVPLCPLLMEPPPAPHKTLESLTKPATIAHAHLFRLLQALATHALASHVLESTASVFDAIVGCLVRYTLPPKQPNVALAYLADLATIVLQFTHVLLPSAFAFDNGLKHLVTAVEDLSMDPRRLALLLRLLSDLTQLPPVVLAFHRLQCLDAFVRLFTSTSTIANQVPLLACLAQSARAGLESEVVSRLALASRGTSTNGALALLHCLNQLTRDAQAHAAYLLSALLLREPELGAGCVSLLLECLEAVDLDVVRHVLVCLSSILHVDGTQEALLRHATVPVLAQILHRADAPCNEHVFRVLAILCSKHKTVCRRVVAANLLPLLLTTVRDLDQPPHNLFHVAWVLSCVTQDADLARRLCECDADVVLELIQYIEYFASPTASKILRVAVHVWGEQQRTAELDIPVDKVATKLLAYVAEVTEPKAQKNTGRVLCLLFHLPALDAVDDVVARVVQYLLNALHGGIDKLTVASLTALAAGLTPETNSNRIIRASVTTNDANLVLLLRLVTPASVHPVLNRLLLALELLTALVHTDDGDPDAAVLARLEPLALPPLLHLLEHDPLTQLNPPTIKALLGLLGTLTRGNVALALSPLMVGAMKRLVEIVQTADAVDATTYHAEALHVLVNLAAVLDLRQSIVLHGGLRALLAALADHDHENGAQLQLLLLGIASLSADDLAKQTIDFTTHVPRFLRLLSAPNANVQALAVWIVSNICVVDSVRRLINAQNGASVLQSLLNEVSNTGPAARPLSSSKRIREMAPKAIKELGFEPLHL